MLTYADSWAVRVGSLGALAVMTVIAVGIGQIFHNIPDLGPLKGIFFDFLFFKVIFFVHA